MFIAADYAAVAPDQKMYLSGANISWQGLVNIPGNAGSLYLAVLLGVPWNLASEPHEFRIRMLDADRKPIGPDPLVEGTAETGRPPGVRAGEEIGVPLAINLTGLPVTSEGTVFFHLSVDEEESAVLPFSFRRAQRLTIAPPEPEA